MDLLPLPAVARSCHVPSAGFGDNPGPHRGSSDHKDGAGGGASLLGRKSRLRAGSPAAQPSPQITKLSQSNTCGNPPICHLFLILLFFTTSQGLFIFPKPFACNHKGQKLAAFVVCMKAEHLK